MYTNYTISGANLHGQWHKTKSTINGFETLPDITCCDVDFNLNQTELIYMGWCYNLFRYKGKLYLTGAWHGKINQLIEVPLPKELSCSSEISLLVTGNDYSLLLFDVNLLNMWVICFENYEDVKKINLNTEMPLNNAHKQLKKYDRLVKVCASNLLSCCLTAQGVVRSGALPSVVDIRGCLGNICDIQCGFEHCLLLTDSGQVYSWGRGRRLQLGHGNLKDLDTPKQIQALAGINIRKIRAGGWHSLALSEFGDVYAWGWNDMGQLGVREAESEDIETDINGSSLKSYGIPTLVDIHHENREVVDVSVKDIACGYRHSAILLEDDSMWTTGCNKYGQIGFASDTITKSYTFRKSYQCLTNSAIKCGPWVTVVINVV